MRTGGAVVATAGRQSGAIEGCHRRPAWDTELQMQETVCRLSENMPSSGSLLAESDTIGRFLNDAQTVGLQGLRAELAPPHQSDARAMR